MTVKVYQNVQFTKPSSYHYPFIVKTSILTHLTDWKGDAHYFIE